MVCSGRDRRVFAVPLAARFVSFGSSRLAKGKKGGRHFTTTLHAVRLVMLLTLLLRYDRGGLCPFLDVRISKISAILAKTKGSIAENILGFHMIHLVNIYHSEGNWG